MHGTRSVLQRCDAPAKNGQQNRVQREKFLQKKALNSDLLRKNSCSLVYFKSNSRYMKKFFSPGWIVHTRLIHSFLYLGLFTPSSCQYCHQVELFVEHFFSCPALTNVRHSHSVSATLFTLSNNQEATTKSLSVSYTHLTLPTIYSV